MKLRVAAVIAAIVALAALVIFCVLHFSQPKDAAGWLERARKIDSANTARITELASQPQKQQELRQRTADAYGEVTHRYAKSPEAEEADFRLLEMDSETTDAAAQLVLINHFADRYPQSKRLPDLRWKAADITQKQLKKPLEAIKLYEAFANEFANDERVPEARFRVASIYEEIKEFQTAVSSYNRVAKDYPRSKFADEAQFRAANLLAEKMEKKQQAAILLEQLQKEHPDSRFADAAASAKKKYEAEDAKSAGEKYERSYYGGVAETHMEDKMKTELKSAPMQRIREQGLDVVHEDVKARLEPEDHTLSATTVMSVLPAKDTSDPIAFQLATPLDVTTVKRRGQPCESERKENFIVVHLGKDPIKAGTTETLEFIYGGKDNDTWEGDVISTSSVFLTLRNWLPVGDFGDNFTADIEIDVPEAYRAVTQGEERGAIVVNGRKKHSYHQDVPAYFYLLIAGQYKTIDASYDRPGLPPVKLQVNLFPENAQKVFDMYLQAIPPILKFFEEHLGPYPYPKLAITQVEGFNGGLGSPGLIMLGRAAFETTATPASFLAHEAAHTWFGNRITPNLAEDCTTWLSEGFAQYWDALYLEASQGKQAFVHHMRTLAANYYAAVSVAEDKPIRGLGFSDPMYTSLSYDKGAFVLHALRGVLGDEKFFAMMKKYAQAHDGGTVTIADFTRAADEANGSSMDWFFKQWLDKPGIPRYRLSDATNLGPGPDGLNQVAIGIEQVGNTFQMPLDVEVETKDAPVRKRFDIHDQFTTVTIGVKSPPVKAVIDPDYWVLKHPRPAEWELPVR